jgi:hypothetical protein
LKGNTLAGTHIIEKQSLYRRIIFPIILVTTVYFVSISIYDFSSLIQNKTLHLALSHTSAVFMFIVVWLGALFGNTIAFFRGAAFGERLVVCLVPPLIRSGYILSSFVGIYSVGEFIFLFLHHIIIGIPIFALLCMGLSEIWCRIIARRKSRDRTVKIFALSNTLVLLFSTAAVTFMLWNLGHTYYYLYMDLYTKLFL